MVESKQGKIPSENTLDEKWDHCLSNLLVKTGIGLGVGIVASALIFRKKSWPITLSTGFGAGVAYAECQRIFNPIALPEQIIRDRLAVEERSLRRVVKKHALLMNSLEQGNLKEVQQLYNDFIVDFTSYELTLTRFQAIHNVNIQETQHWLMEARRIEQEIEATKKVIENLEKELKEEEEIRRNKIQYDALAMEINQHKSREESTNGILEKRSNQLEKVLLVVNEIQTEIQNDKEQYEQILEDNDEHVNTPSSVRSEFISPVENNSPNLSPQQLLNDINDISSSNLIQNDVNIILSSHTLGDKNNEKMDEDDVAATDEIGMDEDDVAAADEIESSEDDSNEIVEDVIDSNFTVKRKKETFSGDEEEEDERMKKMREEEVQ
ncbi:20085_t:CDS:10 [Entrophospora sp. SA101]|nr:11317_t:CDS:10 [Entrophospora sp. SA101]CAJ0755490.1 17021_t:CDS:10 [Entrophospora sp. SA101]CAJ0768767.1 20085_t:CDS:10 [Entrophospora sp. SA101]CAJ0900403.1 1507_t:CDS:10 [Entrophospora sp. SA101]CAJ0922362.1 17465_t:CDS:10 [Entrophospora sp. SA101]